MQQNKPESDNAAHMAAGICLVAFLVIAGLVYFIPQHDRVERSTIAPNATPGSLEGTGNRLNPPATSGSR